MTMNASRISLIIVFLVLSCSPTKGCIESQFNLAPESRIPKWFTIPAGKTRADIKVTMVYYTSLKGPRTATFKLSNSYGFKLADADGYLQGKEPNELKHQPPGYPAGYPSYEIITVNGIVEVIEHRKMEPIFYITDDPIVLKEFGLNN